MKGEALENAVGVGVSVVAAGDTSRRNKSGRIPQSRH